MKKIIALFLAAFSLAACSHAPKTGEKSRVPSSFGEASAEDPVCAQATPVDFLELGRAGKQFYERAAQNAVIGLYSSPGDEVSAKNVTPHTKEIGKPFFEVWHVTVVSQNYGKTFKYEVTITDRSLENPRNREVGLISIKRL